MLELLNKHATAPVVRPDAIVKRVPKALADVLIKMLAKKPEDRYPDMGAVIEALENYLGVSRAGPFTPGEEHANALEKCVRQFNAAPTVKLRFRIACGFARAVSGVCTAYPLCSVGRRSPAASLGLGILTPVFYFLIHGFTRKTPLFLKVRELVLSSGLRDWIVWGVSALLFLVLLLLFGLLGTWVVFSVLAIGAALAVHFGLIGASTRSAPRPSPERRSCSRTCACKAWRKRRCGSSPASTADRVGRNFFEALFGYEAKLAARMESRRNGQDPREVRRVA